MAEWLCRIRDASCVMRIAQKGDCFVAPALAMITKEYAIRYTQYEKKGGRDVEGGYHKESKRDYK